MLEPVLTPGAMEEDRLEAALRPPNFDEFVGQNTVTDNLKVFVEAAKKRNEALDHVLITDLAPLC